MKGFDTRVERLMPCKEETADGRGGSIVGRTPGVVAMATAVAILAGCSPSSDGKTSVPDGVRFSKGDDGWWTIDRGGGDVNKPLADIRRVHVRDFWPGEETSARQGFLTTKDGTAVRALAGGYLVPLFATPDTAYPGGVIDIMKPYRAYFVVRKEKSALLVAEPPFNTSSRTSWVRQGDCYVWATGLTAEVKGNAAFYANEEQARTGSQALSPTEKYVSIKQLASVPGGDKSPALSKLPVLLRTGDLAAVLCPANGGTLCWVNLEKSATSIALARVE